MLMPDPACRLDRSNEHHARHRIPASPHTCAPAFADDALLPSGGWIYGGEKLPDAEPAPDVFAHLAARFQD
jgi:hypothetical protein